MDAAGVIKNNLRWCMLMVNFDWLSLFGVILFINLLINLLIINQLINSGSAAVFDIHGKLVKDFVISTSKNPIIIQECQFWGNGMVAISSTMQLFVVEVIFNILIFEYFNILIF